MIRFLVPLLILLALTYLYVRCFRRADVVALKTHFDPVMLREVELPSPDPFGYLDALMKLTSMAEVVSNLPDSIRREFEPAALPCPTPRHPVSWHEWGPGRLAPDVRNFAGSVVRRSAMVWECRNCPATTSDNHLVTEHRIEHRVMLLSTGWVAEGEPKPLHQYEPQRMWVNPAMGGRVREIHRRGGRP